MSNFNNEELIQYFLDELHSKKEFIQYNDPDDFHDPEQEYGQHIVATQDKLFEKIIVAIMASDDINADTFQSIAEEKRKELFGILSPKIEEYIQTIKVEYR